MSINVSARKHRLLIGGTDWSKALFEVSPWQSSPIDSSGLVKTTATITLIETRDNPGSLDDRVNNTFRIGQSVIVSVTNSLGTLTRHPAGTLRILSAEYNYETRRLTINCGCLITLLSYRQSTNVKDTELKPGVSTPRAAIVQKLLQKAGISSYSVPSLPYPINYPINLQSSYLETIGKLLYSAGYFGWIDAGETFRVALINLLGNAALTLQIGGDLGQELWYRRLTSAEAPREIIEVRGSKRLAQIPKYPTNTTSEKYGPASLVSPDYSNATIVIERETIKTEYDNASRILTSYRYLEQPLGLAVPNYNTELLLSLTTSIYSIAKQQYEQGSEGKLISDTTISYKPFGVVLAEFLEAVDPEQEAYPLRLGLIVASQENKTYTYDTKNRPATITTVQYEPSGVLLENTDFDWSSLALAPTGLQVSASTIETWKQGTNPQEWRHSIAAYSALSRVNPTSIADDATVAQRIALVADPQASLNETSTSGQTVPPAPERCPPDAGFEDVQVVGEARFSQYGGNPYKERERTYQIEYLAGGVSTLGVDYTTIAREDDTDPQCEAVAHIEGKLLYGRFKGQDLGTELHDELFDWQPLMRVNCTEPDGTTRAFALDDSHWYLGLDRCICNFGMIWCGDVSGATESVTVTTTAIATMASTTIQIQPSSSYIPAGTTLVLGGVEVVTTTPVQLDATTIQVLALASSIPSGTSATYTEEVLRLPYIEIDNFSLSSGSSIEFRSYPYPITTTTDDIELSSGGEIGIYFSPKGLFYHIGTNGNTQEWVNPFSSNKIDLFASSSTGLYSNLVNRDFDTDDLWYTDGNAVGDWLVVDIGLERLYIPTAVLIKHDGYFTGFVRNFLVQGSNDVASNDSVGVDAATWTDLANIVNDASINAPFAWGVFPIPVIYHYRWFRIVVTDVGSDGSYYLEMSELEFYGNFYAPTVSGSGLLSNDEYMSNTFRAGN